MYRYTKIDVSQGCALSNAINIKKCVMCIDLHEKNNEKNITKKGRNNKDKMKFSSANQP